jgi:peptidoglycan/xylan/chitin deacetylase (PgdA/CDA1 family)
VSERLLVAPRPGRLVRPGAVALTFDDGPDPYWTPRILAVLARARVRATFCLIGRQAAAHPELVRAIAAGGHALCDHTWDHDEHLAGKPAAVVARQLARTRAAILAAAGRAPVLFRAPGGGWSAVLEAAARRQGMAALKWDVDPRDWARPGTAAVVRVVMAQVRPGSVVLLHDGGGDRSQTLAALSVLLRELPARGYSFQLPQPPR